MARYAGLLAILIAVLALPFNVWGVPDDGAAADPTEGASFVGEKKCRKCHMAQHRTWKKMKHATAWEALPEEYRDGEHKDDSGRVCVSCHTTGYGQTDRGGFADPETSKDLLGVQCEACHGAGSNHAKAGQKVLDDESRPKPRKFKAGEKTYINAKPKGCTDCHNPHVSHKKYKEEK